MERHGVVLVRDHTINISLQFADIEVTSVLDVVGSISDFHENSVHISVCVSDLESTST